MRLGPIPASHLPLLTIGVSPCCSGGALLRLRRPAVDGSSELDVCALAGSANPVSSHAGAPA